MLRGLLVSGLMITAIGCGPKVYPVKGKVTFEDKPMPWGGSIAFVPQGTEKLREAGGIIDEDGNFFLTTEKPGDGAMAGEYRVVIQQVTGKEGKNIGDDGKPGSRADLDLPKKDHIPAKYSDTYNSPLTAKVEAKNANEINIQLKRE